MGSSSKKYKEKEKERSDRADRKRRHRSPSEDESPKDKRKHRRHHHRERKRDAREVRRHEYESNDSDVVEISDRETSPPPSLAKHASPAKSPSPLPDAGSGQAHDSLSIEATNKLRAKLGLKPLQVDTQDAKSEEGKDDGKKKDDWGEFYHKPASNIAQTSKSEKLKTKLSTHKEKRKIEAKLAKVKTLGESDSDDDPSSWVSKSRSLDDAKKKAQQRAKALEELDEQFGVSDTIEKEIKSKKQQKYTEKNLQGLQVLHDVDSFKEGKTVVLTLKDQGVLEEDDDVLVNVNMEDDERYKKNIENKTKKVQYNPYDMEELDEWGNPKPKNLLHKYDEEIDGVKKDSFHIGGYETTAERKQNVLQNIKEKLANKRIECLPESIGDMIHIASDYYNEEELAKFKKPKKKIRKIRQKDKMLTADDLEVMSTDKKVKDRLKQKEEKMIIDDNDEDGRQSFDFDDFKMEEKDDVLERALHKARKLKQRETVVGDLIKEHVAHIKPEIKEEPEADSGNIILNTTAEFCRTLGDIPTYGKAGNREEIEELMDYDKDLQKSDSEDDCQIVEEASTAASNWTNAEASSSGAGAEPILDEEPDVGTGVGAALKLAMSKGYLDKEESNRPSNTRLAYLQAKHYSIEDKNYGEEFDRGNRRERYAGPVQDFREKETFKPNVKLEYIDDDGHVLNSKEAFRYLSHKFHGKGPGKNKIEKRLKKSQQEGLMKKMSSTDTPLGTLNMLQAKQKEMQSPYIVLSGGKTHSTSISKARR